MRREYEIGDTAYLKTPYRGYRYVEITGYDGMRLTVCLTSGYEFSVWEDELESED